MRLPVTTFVALSLVTFAVTADAKPLRTTKKKTAQPRAAVVVAASERLPQLPAPAPAPTVALASAAPPAGAAGTVKPAADRPETAPRTKIESPTGATFEVGAGMRFMSGAMSKDADGVNAFGGVLALRGGYYFTRHLGVLAGVEGSYGYMGKGCVSVEDSHGREPICVAYSVKVPLVAQYAFVNRSRGVYLEGGLSLLNVQVFTAHPTVDSTESLTMFSPVDLSLGAGYRFDVAPLGTDGTRSILDMSLRADVGQFTSGSVSYADRSASRTVAPDDRAFHVALTLNVARRF
jgi:hypothetical protein